MSGISISSYILRKENGQSWNVLSIFIRSYSFTDEYLDEVIAPTFSSAGPFDAFHFVGFPESVELALGYCQQNTTIFQRIKKTAIGSETRIKFITINVRGEIECKNSEGNIVDAADLLDEERRQSLQAVFIKRNGLVTANKGVHYTKPSGHHANQFLRVANVLEDSAFALQITFWLIPYLLTRPIKRIVVDTSGIDSVAFVLGYERVRRNLQFEMPLIESHSSYEGIDKLSVPDPEETLFLISASTSGGLCSELIKQGANANNVLTLFYLGSAKVNHQKVLCDLSFHVSSNLLGLEAIRNYKKQDCPYCKIHSYAIPIVGDQFSTEPARIEEIEIALKDFSESHREVLAQLVSTGLFKVFRSIDGRDFELFLDVDEMLSDSSEDVEIRNIVSNIKTRLHRLIRRGLPIHLQRIIFTNYPGTKNIARTAFDLLPLADKKTAQPVVAGSRDLHFSSVSPETATLVVSACFDETYELMGISRDLRFIQPGGNTTYIAPIFRSCSKSERIRIESNLTYGEHGAKTFNLYSVLQIELPHCEQAHSWRQEFESLKGLIHWCDIAGYDIPKEVESRVELLRSAPSIGLSSNLFWRAPNDIQLQLGSDFTLIPNRDGQRYLSQADVFTVATSLFHQYRQGIEGLPRLIYKPYERAVISPESFQRFSDGILQAAFLRAARSSEIAYRNCDESVSERMFAFLKDEARAVKFGRGAALMEYIISMMIGRLSLHRNHQQDFLEIVLNEELMPNYIKVCAAYTQSIADSRDN